MHLFSDDNNFRNSSNALYTAKKSIVFDSTKVANLFLKLQENSNINENIRIKLNRKPKEAEKFVADERQNFAEQLVYFRNLLGYTQKQVGQAIGVSEDTYRRYELQEIEITDINKIRKLVKFLEFTEEPKLSEYVKFLINKPEKQLQVYLKKNHISKNTFEKLTGISRRTMTDWFNGSRTISKESYKKLIKLI